MRRPRTDDPRSRPRSVRAAVLTHFAVMGAASGVWLARIPSIKHQLALNDALLGTALFAIPSGSIAMLLPAGALVDRFGSGRMTQASTVAAVSLLVPPGWARNFTTLFVTLLAFGASLCVLNIAMNAHAVRVERDYGRPIMASFHAAYSIGGAAGAALGGLFASSGMGTGLTFIVAAIIFLGTSLVACLPLLRREPSASDEAQRSARSTSRSSWLVASLGLLALCGSLTEGAIADWSAVYLNDNLDTSTGFAASGFAVFSIAISTGRVIGDRLARHFGPVRLVRAGALLAAIGLGAGLISGHRVGGLLGFAAAGAGLSCLVPQIITAAGNLDPAHSGRYIARVTALSSIGNLTGPVLIGVVSVGIGLPGALGIPVALLLVIAACATAVTREPPAPRPGAGR
jgi:predicted MFS family arabinose efflux permease